LTLRRDRILDVIVPIATVFVAIVIWQEVTQIFKIPLFILPSPLNILNALTSHSFNWVGDSWSTTYETVAGFILAAAVGIPLAIALVYSQWLSRVMYPVILFFQVVPKVALAPIIFVMIGFGFFPRVVIVFLIVFFPIVIDTMAGLRALDPIYVDLMRSLGFSNFHIFIKARLPNSLPFIFSGFKIAITLALIGAVVAEFVQANVGLGNILLSSMTTGQTPATFASVFLLSIIGAILYLVFSGLERVMSGWYIRSKQVRY
jgi:NitT/TauT family transport system permease protein